MSADAPGLFEVPEPEQNPYMSPDQRRTHRQAQALAHGAHPLTCALGRQIRLHPEAAPADDRQAPGRRCGTCAFYWRNNHHDRTYPKCDRPGRATRGPGTDLRAWWPACTDHKQTDERAEQ